jgi:hypothetical protein
MHSFRSLLLGLFACSLSLLGQTGQTLPSLPPRGTVLMANHEGKLWQLVDVKGRRGVVRQGNQELTLPKEQSYLPMRNDDLAPGYIDVIKDQSVTDYYDGPAESDSVASRAKVYVTGNQFEAYVQSTTSIEDCCIVLIYVNNSYLKGADPELHCTMVLNRVGDLAPGKKKLIRITMTDIKANAFNSAYCVLFLSKGREVKSSYSQITDRTMSMIEARQHVLSVERYIEENREQDKPVAVYSQERVRLPQHSAGVAIPDSVEATFTVDSEGNVGGLEIPQASLPKDLYLALYASVSAWRFLPKLEHGRAVPCVVRIPISLKT